MFRLLAACALFTTACMSTIGDAPSPEDEGLGGADLAPGLTIGLVTGRFYDEMARDLGTTMRDFSKLGAKLIRVEIEGSDFGKYRRIVDAAKRYGIEVLAVVQSPAVGVQPLSIDIEDYANRYIATVDRLLAEIPNLRYIEVENEPDVYDFTPLAGDHVERFARLTVRVYEHYVRTRGGDGRPQLVAFDFSRQDQPAFDAVYNAEPITNHRNYFRQAYGLPDGLPADIVSIHGYGEKALLPDTPGYGYEGRTFAGAVESFLGRQFTSAPTARTDDQRYNTSLINQSPVWYTEVGYEWGHLGGEHAQAEALRQSFATLARYPQIRAAFYYNWRDDPDGETAGLRGNGSTGAPNECQDENHASWLLHAPHAAYDAFRGVAGGGRPSTFIDVPTCYWADVAIEALYAHGVTTGCEGSFADGSLKFCPERQVSQGEVEILIQRAAGRGTGEPRVSDPATRTYIAKQLAAARGTYAPYAGRFVDVGPSTDGVEAIEGLAAAGIINGFPLGDGRYEFRPDELLTRAQMAALLTRAYGLQ